MRKRKITIRRTLWMAAGLGLLLGVLHDSADNPGARMPDGSVFAGISPDGNRAIYTTPKDAPLTYTFDQAQRACAVLDAHRRADWRMPTKAELNLLFQNRAAIGNFNTSGSNAGGWYWSSSPYGDYTSWALRLSDGTTSNDGRNTRSSLRCVRD